MLCEDACGNPENLVRIARDSRAGSQKCGDIRSNKIGNPRKNSRPIPQYSTIYKSPSIYIEKKNPSNEDHLSINIIRWYSYHYNCVLYENLLPRSYFLISINFPTVSKDLKPLNIKIISRYDFSNS
jgi:hypothetical protein